MDDVMWQQRWNTVRVGPTHRRGLANCGNARRFPTVVYRRPSSAIILTAKNDRLSVLNAVAVCDTGLTVRVHSILRLMTRPHEQSV